MFYSFQDKLSIRRKKDGFTLIELLVVIAIIAILAAILFPVFARARENARRSSCQSNLKQISLGIMQYSQDFDERYLLDFQDRVPSPVAQTPGPTETGWAYLLMPYTKSGQIFRCPSEKTPNPWPVDADSQQNLANATDYYYNRNLGRTRDALNNLDPGTSGINLAELAFPANTVMLGEAICGTGSGNTCNPGFTALGGIFDTTYLAALPNGAEQHLEGANYAFTDGHVKWVKGDDLSTSTDKSAQIYGYGSATNPSGSTYSFKFK